MMDRQYKEFVTFLESIEDVDPKLINSIRDASEEIFLEGKKPIAQGIEALIDAGKKIFRSSDEVAGGLKKSADDVIGGVKKSSDDLLSGTKKSADDVSNVKKAADDVPTKKLDDELSAKKKKPSKIKKLAKSAAAMGLSGILGGIVSDLLSSGNEAGAEEFAKRTATVPDRSGRFWPTNFNRGNLTPHQMATIDTFALFGPPSISDELISVLNQDAPLNAEELQDAAIRYAEVYNYWTDVYDTGMRLAYDDQMDKG